MDRRRALARGGHQVGVRSEHVGEQVHDRHADRLEVRVVRRERGEAADGGGDVRLLPVAEYVGRAGEGVDGVVDVGVEVVDHLLRAGVEGRHLLRVLGGRRVGDLHDHRDLLHRVAVVEGGVGACARVHVEVAADPGGVVLGGDVVLDVVQGAVRAGLLGRPRHELHRHGRARPGGAPVVGHDLRHPDHLGVALAGVPCGGRRGVGEVVVAGDDDLLLRVVGAGDDAGDVERVAAGARETAGLACRAHDVGPARVHERIPMDRPAEVLEDRVHRRLVVVEVLERVVGALALRHELRIGRAVAVARVTGARRVVVGRVSRLTAREVHRLEHVVVVRAPVARRVVDPARVRRGDHRRRRRDRHHPA